MKALSKILLALTAVAALSFGYPTSVQAVPTTYQYTGNPFTQVSGPYTTSDFVSGMVTLAGPLPPNFSGTVTPTAFTFSDGVQTITNLTGLSSDFMFVTGPTGQIISWGVGVFYQGEAAGVIQTSNQPGELVFDFGVMIIGQKEVGHGLNNDQPGGWVIRSAVADTGSTLSMMTLTLMALGVAARQFKRAAA